MPLDVYKSEVRIRPGMQKPGCVSVLWGPLGVDFRKTLDVKSGARLTFLHPYFTIAYILYVGHYNFLIDRK